MQCCGTIVEISVDTTYVAIIINHIVISYIFRP
jgi:hypothetical protein